MHRPCPKLQSNCMLHHRLNSWRCCLRYKSLKKVKQLQASTYILRVNGRGRSRTCKLREKKNDATSSLLHYVPLWRNKFSSFKNIGYTKNIKDFKGTERISRDLGDLLERSDDDFRSLLTMIQIVKKSETTSGQCLYP